jgi:glycosyltransferase involved in cell wall biosynthesis
MRALHSIANQTYRNINIVVVNDGSTDETLALIKEFIATDSRVICVNQKNSGLVNSLNNGLKKCSGKYIARMDADDVSSPHRIENVLCYMLENNLDVCGSYINVVDQSLNLKWKKKYPKNNEMVLLTMPLETPFAHPAVMFKKSVLNDIKYEPIYDNCEDYRLWSVLAKFGYRFGNCPTYELDYVIHPSQVSNLKRTRQKLLSRKISFQAFTTLERLYGHKLSVKLPIMNRNLGYCELMCIYKFYLFMEISLVNKLKLIPYLLKYGYRELR